MKITYVRQPFRGYRGVTLVELLAVIGVVTFLVAVIIPVWGQVRSSTMTMKCSSNLRSLAIAGQLFVQDNGGYFSDDGIYYHTAYEDNQGRKRPGLRDYLEMSVRTVGLDTVFTCPALQLTHETSGFNSNHNYGVNINATTQFSLDDDGNNYRPAGSPNFYRLPFPEEMAFVMDGRATSKDDRGYYFSNNVSADTVHAFLYPHNKSNNVVYFSGRVERFTLDQLTAIPANDRFWTGEE